MQKIFLIAQREYLIRVRKKSFLISTILMPLLFVGLMAGSVLLTKNSIDSESIAIIDNYNQFEKADLESISTKEFSYKLVKEDSATIHKALSKLNYTGYCILPKLSDSTSNKLIIHTKKSKAGITESIFNTSLNKLWNTKKLKLLGIDLQKKNQYDKSTLIVSPQNINDKQADGKVAGGISQTLGILIYFVILIYGSQVMMSVMEEKTNRIAEVVVSSVKPFQLMFGKIIGVGLVALTQFLLWIGLILIAYNVMSASSSNTGMAGEMVNKLQSTFSGINFNALIIFFIIYFIGGFFFYASIYAAIGSAVNEDIRDAQQLSFPVTMLVIMSLMIAQVASNNPNSSLAFWGSMIPVCSPFVMIGRIAYGIPTAVAWWEIALSLVILFGSIVLVTWASAKIYRTGILMYGKKVTFKELIKWVRL